MVVFRDCALLAVIFRSIWKTNSIAVCFLVVTHRLGIVGAVVSSYRLQWRQTPLLRRRPLGEMRLRAILACRILILLAVFLFLAVLMMMMLLLFLHTLWRLKRKTPTPE